MCIHQSIPTSIDPSKAVDQCPAPKHHFETHKSEFSRRATLHPVVSRPSISYDPCGPLEHVHEVQAPIGDFSEGRNAFNHTDKMTMVRADALGH
jgi:hypothetical protein